MQGKKPRNWTRTFCSSRFFLEGVETTKNWMFFKSRFYSKIKKENCLPDWEKKLGSPSQSWEVGKFQPQIFPAPALFVCCKNKNSSGFPHIELNTKLLWTPFLQDLLALLHLHLPFGRRSSNKQTKKETSRSQWVHQKDHCSLVCRMPVVFKFKSERLMEGSPTPKNNWIPSSWWLSVLKSWGWPTRSSHNKKIHQRRSMKGPQQKNIPYKSTKMSKCKGPEAGQRIHLQSQHCWTLIFKNSR